MSTSDDDDPLPGLPTTDAPTRRPICPTCRRPTPTCLCRFLPSTPIPTTTTVLILQHPHELRRALSTVPPLTLSLLNTHLLPPSRTLKSSLHPLLSSPFLFLFPSPSAVPITDTPSPVPSTLVVFDGTWEHAREMVRASEGVLREWGTQVEVGRVERGVDGESMVESEVVLRKEPWKGCVSTMEAVARALRVLEGEERGREVEGALMEVLRGVVGVQRGFFRGANPKFRVKKMKIRKGRDVDDGGGAVEV